jgi:predicted nucleic-acid-binding protein
MIGLDTNVLVRYLTQDDMAQSPKATEWIERRLTADWRSPPRPGEKSPEQGNPGFISVVAAAETAWVLESIYRLSDVEIASAIERLLQVDVLVFENEQQVFVAMIALKEGRGSFADALIAELGAKAGCSHTLTFDQGALRLPGFEHP